MGRIAPIYLLIAAVFSAAAGLAFYSYTYSRRLASADRVVLMRTMGELAAEKVVGIESAMIKADLALFERADINNLEELKEALRTERPAIRSVFILDDKLQIVPGGAFSGRVGADQEAFRSFFRQEVVPRLGLLGAPRDTRQSFYRSYDGRPYLFSWSRKVSDRRTFFIVVEEDLTYLIAQVFPQYFQVQSQHRYLVVDEHGELVFGFPFRGIPAADVVELPFSETATGWRLRVAHKNRAALTATKKRQVVDLILIGSALAVIAVGLAFLLVAVRRARRANQLKSDFISNVSHELKTPLSIISMFGELLAMGRTKSPEQATEYAGIIRRESIRLSGLIDNVLDFAKIERGADELQLVEGDVIDVVERAVELSGYRAERAEIKLSFEVDGEIPLAPIDANALTLAVLNLIDNAIKYAAAGGKIDVELRADPGKIVLQVRDYGPGIAKDEQHAIFERFYRAKAVRLKPVRGSGIGLALVKHISAAHGGGLELESAEGEGATFRLWIPTQARG